MTDPSRSVLDSGRSVNRIRRLHSGRPAKPLSTCPGFADPRLLQDPQHPIGGIPGQVDDLVLRLAGPAWPDDGLRRDLLGEAFGRTGAAVGRVDGDGGQVGHR
jgi:hypothetical protein